MTSAKSLTVALRDKMYGFIPLMTSLVQRCEVMHVVLGILFCLYSFVVIFIAIVCQEGVGVWADKKKVHWKKKRHKKKGRKHKRNRKKGKRGKRRSRRSEHTLLRAVRDDSDGILGPSHRPPLFMQTDGLREQIVNSESKLRKKRKQRRKRKNANTVSSAFPTGTNCESMETEPDLNSTMVSSKVDTILNSKTHQNGYWSCTMTKTLHCTNDDRNSGPEDCSNYASVAKTLKRVHPKISKTQQGTGDAVHKRQSSSPHEGKVVKPDIVKNSHLQIADQSYRQSTFASVDPVQGVQMTSLAVAGFFCISGNSDPCTEDTEYSSLAARCQCAFCNLVFPVEQFIGREPVDVHREASPSCPFVLGHDSLRMCCAPMGNSVASQTDGVKPHGDPAVVAGEISRAVSTTDATSQTDGPPLHTNSAAIASCRHTSVSSQAEQQERRVARFERCGIFSKIASRPDLVMSADRESTFRGWPHLATHPPSIMAEAGFYYTGDTDGVRCFCCGTGVKTWESNDVPWIEHGRWFPSCDFLRLCQGQSFVDAIQTLHCADNSQKITEEDVLKEMQRQLDEEYAHGRTAKAHPEKSGGGAIALQNACSMETSEHSSDIRVPQAVSSEVPAGVFDPDREPQQGSILPCMHCKTRMREVLLPCGHRNLCNQCFNCPFFWGHRYAHPQHPQRPECWICWQPYTHQAVEECLRDYAHLSRIRPESGFENIKRCCPNHGKGGHEIVMS